MAQGLGKALITGGGSGIGLAIAQRLQTDGFDVLIAGRDEAKLAATGMASATMDVADRASVDKVAREHGPFAVVVSSAGIAPTAPALKTTPEMWAEVVGINLTGCYNLAMATLPAMAEARRGRFVAIASTSSLRAYRYTMAYTASKHGVLGLVRALALELADSGVTCNAVCPGFTDTEIVRGAIRTIVEKTGRSHDEALDAFTRDNPTGRLIEPDEIAHTVSWLCSDAAVSVNGAAIPVDGGELAG
jgi:NAD(P)-dependent dehydrogenase (short-subunit alcohol dehydrogenase family)